MTVNNEIFSFFIEETTDLMKDLVFLGESLKGVGVPSEEESIRLSDFAQKLNRLIGGTASVGFDIFSPLARKTSMLAESCSNIKGMPVRLLILNLNNVVQLFSKYFQTIELEKDAKISVTNIEKKIDICLSAVDLKAPDIKSQNEIDDILSDLGL
jgi:hypothetical protein